MRIPLPSRPFECPVSFPVTDRSATVASDPSLRPTGADEAEAEAAQTVASDPSVIDAERDPLYGDRVDQLIGDARFALRGGWAEALRQSRLSRWQEQR